MKKETILDIFSSIVFIGAILFELFNQIKETGELSIRTLLMNTPSPAMSVTTINNTSTNDNSTELFIWNTDK